jgi:hypothetical protein
LPDGSAQFEPGNALSCVSEDLMGLFGLPFGARLDAVLEAGVFPAPRFEGFTCPLAVQW